MDIFKQDIIGIQTLIERINNGRLKLPSFQRDYKWTSPKVSKLLDSIQKQHPAGSLLFLEVDKNNPIIAETPFKFTKENLLTEETEFLVLDGQQRLTSCYSAFYNIDKSYYLNLRSLYESIKVKKMADIDFEDLITVKKNEPFPDQYLARDLLPLYFLKNKVVMWEKLASYKESLRNDSGNADYLKFLELTLLQYLDSFFNYAFPVIILPKELPLDAVCKVFQTINTTGLKLSAFDICVAKFMRNKLDLRSKVNDAKKNDNVKIVLKSDETIILQTIALLAEESPKKNKLADNLKEIDITTWWDKAVIGLDTTISLLDKFGCGCLKDLSLLPYQPILPVIAAILIGSRYHDQNTPSKSSIEQKLKIFFYHSALSLRYTEGTDNKMKDDHKMLKNWIAGDSEPQRIKNGIPWNTEKFIGAKKGGGAIAKAILCLINYNKPMDFYNDYTVGVGIGVADSQLHHMFPIATYSNDYGDKINSVFNFTFLTPESNNYIKNKSTNNYLKGIIEERNITEQNLKEILKKHHINDVTYNHYVMGEYDSFLKSRAENIKLFLENSIGVKTYISNELMEDSGIEDDLDLDENEQE